MNEIKISSENKYNIDDDLILFKFSNLESDSKSVFFETQTNFIQFHFCLKGECNFIYNKGSYCLPLKNEVSILLYNPISPLPVDVRIESESRLVCLLISIEKLHGLFSKDSETIPFLSELIFLNGDVGCKHATPSKEMDFSRYLLACIRTFSVGQSWDMFLGLRNGTSAPHLLATFAIAGESVLTITLVNSFDFNA